MSQVSAFFEKVRNVLGAGLPETRNLSGAYLGHESIPENWASRLENYEYLQSLSKQPLFVKTYS